MYSKYMDFNITEYEKLNDMKSGSTLQLICFRMVKKKKNESLQLSKMVIEILLSFPSTDYVTWDFLHNLQMKQHITTD